MSTAAVSAAASGTTNGLVYVMAMIASGTLNTVFSKMQYGVRAEGTELCVDPLDPTKMTTLCAFDKPWFGALLAKIGMTLSLVYLGVRHLQQTRRGANKAAVVTESSSLLAPDGTTRSSSTRERLPLKTIVAIAWPSLLDLLQTLISNVGLLWVSSSVYQMARGSVIVFSALVSVHFLHKRLHAYHYASIAMVCVAVVLVGWAGTPHGDPLESSSSSSSTHAVLGLSLIVTAQLITAVQIVAEEYIMTQLHVEPLLLVGVEGLWGLLFYVFLIPLLTLTPAGNSGDATAVALAKIWHEDFADSVIKISQSSTLVVLSLLNIAAVAALGPSANYVTKHLSGVMRSIAEVLRTLGVWLAGLFVFYAIGWRGIGSPGEAWTVYSWIELLGFTCMVYGTLAFKKIIQIPFPVLYSNANNAKQLVPPSLSTQEPAFA